MKSIITKWMLYCFGISFIPVVLLGASPGGIALSPVFLALGIGIGLFGSSVHVFIKACIKGNKRQKILASSYFVFVASILIWQIYVEAQCNLTEEQASARLERHMQRFERFNPEEIGKPELSVESCSFYFPLNNHHSYKAIIIDELLDVYMEPID